MGGRRPPTFFDRGTRPPLSHFLGLKFVQKLVHCCNWLLTETQCKIISVQHVCRPKLFKRLLSLVLASPHFLTTPLKLASAKKLATIICPCKFLANVASADNATVLLLLLLLLLLLISRLYQTADAHCTHFYSSCAAHSTTQKR